MNKSTIAIIAVSAIATILVLRSLKFILAIAIMAGITYALLQAKKKIQG